MQHSVDVSGKDKHKKKKKKDRKEKKSKKDKKDKVYTCFVFKEHSSQDVFT